MEGILTELAVGSGVFLAALSLLVLVVGGILLSRLADDEKRGKRFYWAEWPLPESESDFSGEDLARHAA